MNRDADQGDVSRRGQLLEFDVLRAVATIMLLILHSLVLYVPVNGVSLEPVGPFMETYFLGAFSFMAGYFAEISFRHRERGVFSFIKSKFIRIYPPYLVALFLFVLILGYTLKRRDWAVYLLNLQFILSPVFAKHILTLWYISVLMGYYAVFILLLVHTPSGKALFVVTALIFGLGYLLNRATGLVDGRFLEYLFAFVVGVYLSRNQRVFEWFLSSRITFSLLFAALSLWFYWFARARDSGFFSWQYLVSVNLFIVSWVLLSLRIFKMGISGWTIWQPISYASFLIYLYHRPLWALLSRLDWGAFARDDGVWIRLLPGSVIVLVVCYFLQRGYDRLIAALRLTS